MFLFFFPHRFKRKEITFELSWRIFVAFISSFEDLISKRAINY
jgi:hypothetical protein